MRLKIYQITLLKVSILWFCPAFAEDEESEEDIIYETAYYPISPDIVTNVKGKAKYIRTKIQIMTDRADMLWEIEEHDPLYRHVLLMILADKKGEDIKSPAGKESLRKEFLKALSDALDEKASTKGLIKDLFFTTYYVK